jgi:protection-of-telomeres protein 1
LSNWASEFHLFPAKLPAWPITSSSGLPRPVSTSGQLTTDILRYIAWLQVHINREAIPDEDEFNDKAVNALKNIRQKYSLLKDIQDKKFYNLIGEVIRVFDNSGKISMYLSDYTENQHFYFQAYPLSENIGMLTRLSRDGDDYGYIKPKFNASNETKEWPGPYGKQAIQLSIYDQHALFVRERVKVGQWVKLRNVHVKFGSNGAHLEGFLRQDLGAHQDKIQVEVLTQAENPEMNDPNWKEAVRRKKQYWDKYKKQVKLLAEELKLDAKRKCEDEGEAVVKKPNRKMRRQEMMKQAEKKLTIREDNSATEQSPKRMYKAIRSWVDVNCDVQRCRSP